MTTEELAQIAYEAFASVPGQLHGAYTWRGWEELSKDERKAWLAAASAVKKAVLGPLLYVNET